MYTLYCYLIVLVSIHFDNLNNYLTILIAATPARLPFPFSHTPLPLSLSHAVSLSLSLSVSVGVKLASARSYGVLKSLRCSARYAKSKSKSAINLSAHSKQQQKNLKNQAEQTNQEQKQERHQPAQPEEALYANVDEIIQSSEFEEEDALMGNAQVSPNRCCDR